MSQSDMLSKNKILYIDDDPNNSIVMKRILEADGYQVLLAPSGSQGVAQAHRERPDLILLDIYMPDINGHEVARRLRRMERTKDIPILVVSASTNPQERRLSLEAGCDGYISKPIDVDLISEQVAAFL